MELKDAVRTLRVALGMTQEELAQRAEGLTRATVAKIETGANKGTAAGMAKVLAEALHLREEELSRLVDGALSIEDASALANARQTAAHTKRASVLPVWLRSDSQRLAEAASSVYSHTQGHRAPDLQMIGQLLAPALGRFDLPSNDQELQAVVRWLLDGASLARSVRDPGAAPPQEPLDAEDVASLMMATVLVIVRRLSPVTPASDEHEPATATVVLEARELLLELRDYMTVEARNSDIEFMLEDVARWGHCTRAQAEAIRKAYASAYQNYQNSRRLDQDSVPF